MPVIKLRRNNTANWASENPILAEGELGIELDSNTFKIGNGTTPWLDLPYFASGGEEIHIGPNAPEVSAYSESTVWIQPDGNGPGLDNLFYKDPETGEWSSTMLASDPPNEIYISPDEPTDPEVELWIDTDEVGRTEADLEAKYATKTYVDVAMPIGSIIAYGGSSAPEGWHLCDGSEHNSPALELIIGSAFSPDLQDRFVIAAGRQYVVDQTGGAKEVQLGIEHLPSHAHGGGTGNVDINHQHTGRTGHHADGYNAAHAHAGTNFRTGTGGPPEAGGWDGNIFKRHTDAAPGGYWNDININAANTDHQHDFTSNWMSQNNVHNHAIPAEGGNQAHENMPPFYALTYIIKKVGSVTLSNQILPEEA